MIMRSLRNWTMHWGGRTASDSTFLPHEPSLQKCERRWLNGVRSVSVPESVIQRSRHMPTRLRHHERSAAPCWTSLFGRGDVDQAVSVPVADVGE